MTTQDPRLWTAGYRRTRLFVLDRDRWQCQIGGPRCSSVATEVDHIVARVDGGNCFDPANLRAACRACNAGGGAAITRRRGRGSSAGGADYVTRF